MIRSASTLLAMLLEGVGEARIAGDVQMTIRVLSPQPRLEDQEAMGAANRAKIPELSPCSGLSDQKSPWATIQALQKSLVELEPTKRNTLEREPRLH